MNPTTSPLPEIPLTKTCPHCKRTFSTTTNLKNHILTIHIQNFPFKCSFPNCMKKYAILSRLKVHMRTHIENKPFKCEVCSKTFVTKADLKTHIKFHSDARPFKCPKCIKAYKTNEHLKDHIEIFHYKIKKFLCEQCKHSFGKSSALKAHQRTHTGEKNFKCLIEECGKLFAEKGNMIIHYKRHLKRIERNTMKNKVKEEIMKKEEEIKNSQRRGIYGNCLMQIGGLNTIYNGYNKEWYDGIKEEKCLQFKKWTYGCNVDEMNWYTMNTDWNDDSSIITVKEEEVEKENSEINIFKTLNMVQEEGYASDGVFSCS